MSIKGENRREIVIRKVTSLPLVEETMNPEKENISSADIKVHTRRMNNNAKN